MTDPTPPQATPEKWDVCATCMEQQHAVEMAPSWDNYEQGAPCICGCHPQLKALLEAVGPSWTDDD